MIWQCVDSGFGWVCTYTTSGGSSGDAWGSPSEFSGGGGGGSVSTPSLEAPPDDGGGLGGVENRSKKPSISKKLYDDCAKKAFGGTQGDIKGTDRQIPSIDLASLTFDAATFAGVDPGVVGATMALESNSGLDMTTNENTNGTLDYGPMQINSDYVGSAFPDYPGATGTNLKGGDPFNGDVFANIASGAHYLGSRRLRRHPEKYVGTRGAKARKRALGKLLPSFDAFYDCIRNGLGLGNSGGGKKGK